MTLTATTPFARPNAAFTALRRSVRPRLRSGLRNMAFAACLSLSTAMFLHADELQQSWLPDALQLPADMDVLTDRSIGSTLRMFSFTTEDDVDALLLEWQEELRLAGYTIHQPQRETPGQVIEFSGQGIINAKIAVAPIKNNERTVIEFDATLE